MPPNPKVLKPPIAKLSSSALVPVGPRDVQVHHDEKRKRGVERPTTSRALVLRNGRNGARGTGEVVPVSRITGREKLDLLAEDLMRKAQTAVRPPFRLKECLKIAESQLNAHLDVVSDLHDPEAFYDTIKADAAGRIHPEMLSKTLQNPTFVAKTVGTIIHNAYMLASAWRIIRDILQELRFIGVDDTEIRSQLRDDEYIRSLYLALYHTVGDLVAVGQSKLGILAMLSAHYKKYFRLVEPSDSGESGVAFDWDGLRNVYRSFLDSIVIELCLPNSHYPRHILFQILHDSVTEAPHETKRFPQAMYDAVGDLSVLVKLYELLESPLLGPEGEAWVKAPCVMPDVYDQWVEAQGPSSNAADKCANFEKFVFPLDRTKNNKDLLTIIWRQVNTNYNEVCGTDVDTLWQLSNAQRRSAKWHCIYKFNQKQQQFYDSDSDSMPELSSSKRNGKTGKKDRLAITQGEGSEDDMPPLLAVSDSSDNDSDLDSDADSNEDEDEDQDGTGSDYEYDTDEEDEMREQFREAMDTAAAMEGFLDPRSPAPDLDDFVEERKSNPFLKLLGNLRGRMFSSSAALKTGARTRTGQSSVPLTSPRDSNAPRQDRQKHATVEEVEDEDDVSVSSKKKKKKKKPKKKPSNGTAAGERPLTPVFETASSAVTPSEPSASPSSLSPASPASTVQVPSTPSPKKKPAAKSPPPRSPSINDSRSTLPHMSTASLPLPLEQTAQSARSYLQSENLIDNKNKVKSRPNYATSLVSTPEVKRGFMSKLGVVKKSAADEEEEKKPKSKFFARMTKKTTTLMHQLIGSSSDVKKGQAPMKWESFLKVMREMGFEYHPDTAGSSVRFDPPDPRDEPITFHKPHPDSTLYPVMLKEFGKRLKRQYGWTEEQFAAFNRQ